MGKKVIIVEDNELNLKLFTDLLRAHQYEVTAKRDGRDIIETVQNIMPDLIIMDIQLPNISGLDLIETISADAQLSHIPILAVTAYAGKGDEERILTAGAKAYLSKPVSVMNFLAAVNSVSGA